MSKINHVYQGITDLIVKAIENDGLTNKTVSWASLGGGLPLNPTTKRSYNGINTLVLSLTAQNRGYSQSMWAGYKQWINVGCKINSSARGNGVFVLFAKPIHETDEESGDVISTHWLYNYQRVFNIAHVDGWQSNEAISQLVKERTLDDSRDFSQADQQNVENLVQACGVKIVESFQASYSPHEDVVRMPPMYAFEQGASALEAAESYYAVLLHELTHWTMHPTRCNRDNSDYAFEELVAELGSAFLCQRFGVTQRPREDHANYIASWLRKLKNDNRAIVKAANKAQRACDFLENYANQYSIAIAA